MPILNREEEDIAKLQEETLKQLRDLDDIFNPWEQTQRTQQLCQSTTTRERRCHDRASVLYVG